MEAGIEVMAVVDTEAEAVSGAAVAGVDSRGEQCEF